MSPLTVGGILKVAGYTDFLGNLGTRKSADDPLRHGIAMIGREKNGYWYTAADLVRCAKRLGCVKRVIPEADRENDDAMARGLGVVLTPHDGETFEYRDVNTGETAKLWLTKSDRRRWTKYDQVHRRRSPSPSQPHHRYLFQVLKGAGGVGH